MKRVFKFFSIFGYEKEEQYLRKMHNNGYKLSNVSLICLYTFEKCEKEDVVYRLDFQDSFKDENGYIKMFKDCGWEYIQDYLGYKYFRKRITNSADNDFIFSDNSSRMEMIQRVYKRRLLPLLLLFFSSLIPSLISAVNHREPVIVVLLLLLVALYLIIFISALISYLKFKKKRNC